MERALLFINYILFFYSSLFFIFSLVSFSISVFSRG